MLGGFGRHLRELRIAPAPVQRPVEPVFTRHYDGDGRTRTTVELNDALVVDRLNQKARLEMDFAFGNLVDPLFVLDQFIAIAAAVRQAAHPDTPLGILGRGSKSYALAYVELRQLAREAGAEFDGADPDVRDMARAVRAGLGRRMVEVTDATWCSDCKEPATIPLGTDDCCGLEHQHPLYRLAPERAVRLPPGMHVVTQEDFEAAQRPLDAIVAGSVYLRELSDDRMVSRNVLAVEFDTVRYVEFDTTVRDDEQRLEAKEGSCSVAEFVTWHCGPVKQPEPEVIPGFRIVFEQAGDEPNLTFVEVEDLDGNSIDIGRWIPAEEYDHNPDAEKPLCALELPVMTVVPKEPSLLLVASDIPAGHIEQLSRFVKAHGGGPHTVLSRSRYGGRKDIADALVASGRSLGRHDAEPACALERAAEVLTGIMPLVRSLGGPEHILTETKCGRLDNLLASIVDRGRADPPLALLVTNDGRCHVLGSGIPHKMPMVTATHMVLTRALSKLEAREVLPRLAPSGKWRFINEHWSTWHSADSAWDGALVAGERL